MLCTLACGGSDSTQPGDNLAHVGAPMRVVNASALQLNLLVDGQTAATGIQVGGVSGPISITAGSHELRLTNGTTTSAPVMVTAVDGKELIAVVRGAANTGITSSILADTGAIVPANKSKLRVVHASANAGDNVEIWRTQPDFQTPTHIMTPFAYGAESPYLQSDPGTWEVFITAPGGATKLATTGAINIPAGERRTAVLLDSAKIIFFRVVVE